MAVKNSGTPTYLINVDGSSDNETLMRCITSLTVTHNPGFNSDTLQMQLSDQSALLKIPLKQKKIDIWMGYELNLAPMGSFYINRRDLSASISGQYLSVSGTPSLLRNERTESWHDMTVKDIVSAIAKRNQLTARVSLAFGKPNYKIRLLQQYQQSDMAFIQNLANRYNAMAKTMMDSLVFLRYSQTSTSSGLPFLPIMIEPSQVINWQTQLNEQHKYDGVIVRYYDLLNAEQNQAIAGNINGDRLFRLSQTSATPAEARAQAESKYQELNRGNAVTMSLTIIGDPNVTCEMPIILLGVRPEIDGKWIVQTATHSLDTNGYQTTMTLYRDVHTFAFPSLI